MDRYELITHNPPLSLRPWSTQIDLQAFWNLHHQPSNQESGNLPYQSSKTAWFCKLEREKKKKQNTRKPGKQQRPERGKFHPGWRRDMIISLEEDFILVCNQVNLSIDQSFILFLFIFIFFASSTDRPAGPNHSAFTPSPNVSTVHDICIYFQWKWSQAWNPGSCDHPCQAAPDSVPSIWLDKKIFPSTLGVVWPIVK